MSTALITEEQLAERFGVDVDQVQKLRRRYGWPCVKLGRWDVRYTEAQVEEIVRLHTDRPAKEATPSKPVGAIPGQTPLSAARSK